MMRSTIATLGVVLVLPASSAVVMRQPTQAVVPLCPGLTIVTAISQRLGDYESIKQVESIGREGQRIRYSSYRPDPRGDYESTTVTPPPWLPFTVRRTVTAADLEGATEYMQQFAPEGVPEIVPGTTALGISRALYLQLKSGQPVPLTVYQPVLPGQPLKADREPGDVDYRLPGEISRVEPRPVPVPVLVNERLVSLPALHARGTFLWDEGEFFFLDDPQNPITLRFTIGNDQLRVIKMTYGCGAGLPAGTGAPGRPGPGDGAGTGIGLGGGGAATGSGSGTGGGGGGAGSGSGSGGSAGSGTPSAAAIESALAESGKVDVYSIYFDFNSARIREESEPTLRDIAGVLQRHPDWRLTVNGHTDSIASDAYNLDLSRQRAAAVRDALVKRYRLDERRLSTAGFGESQPRDTNDTLEGRARNRRVELVRQ